MAEHAPETGPHELECPQADLQCTCGFYRSLAYVDREELALVRAENKMWKDTVESLAKAYGVLKRAAESTEGTNDA